LKRDYFIKRNEATNPDEVVMPNVVISGQAYEVTGQKALISNLIGWARTIGLIFLFAGDFVFSFLGGVERMPSVV